MNKKIICVFLALLLSCSMVLSPGTALPVRASSVAYSPEASIEIMEILYTLLINGMIASGASNMKSLDYDSAMDLLGAFMDSACKSASMPGTEIEIDADAVYMVLDNGTVITWGDIVQSYTDGTGALQLPDEETWQNFRVVDGGSGSAPGPGGNKDFSKVEAIKIGTSFMAAMSAWIYDLVTGNVADVNADSIFYPDGAPFTGYNVGEDGLYHFNSLERVETVNCSHIWCFCDSHTNVYSILNPVISFPCVAVVVSGSSNCGLYTYQNGKLLNGSLYPPFRELVSVYKPDGELCPSPNSSRTNPYTLTVYSLDLQQAAAMGIPIFASQDDALAFLQQQDAAGLLNGETYDFPLLASVLATSLHPLTGFYFDPAALPGISHALDAAVAPLPLPDADPAANTEAYKEAVAEAVAEAVPDALPDPVPEPSPEPNPDAGEVEKYKTDLRMVFPFCLPFDFIHFLKVMDAEPVAPCFEFPFVVPALGIDMTVDIDLSFMNDAVEIFRLGELVSFVLLLIAVTPKLIRW